MATMFFILQQIYVCEILGSAATFVCPLRVSIMRVCVRIDREPLYLQVLTAFVSICRLEVLPLSSLFIFFLRDLQAMVHSDIIC